MQLVSKSGEYQKIQDEAKITLIFDVSADDGREFLAKTMRLLYDNGFQEEIKLCVKGLVENARAQGLEVPDIIAE